MMKLCSTKGYGRQGELDGFDFPLIKGGCEHAQTFRLVENRASIREAGLPASIELPVAQVPVYLIISNLPRINLAFLVARRAHGKGRARPIRTVYVQRPDELPEYIAYRCLAQRLLYPPSRPSGRRFR